VRKRLYTDFNKKERDAELVRVLSLLYDAQADEFKFRWVRWGPLLRGRAGRPIGQPAPSSTHNSLAALATRSTGPLARRGRRSARCVKWRS